MIFIAEIGMNYNGNFPLCYEMIKQAKHSGASIAKFQLGWRDKPGEINELDEIKIKKLYEWANYFEIDLMFSIISDQAFELIKKFKPKKVKIASKKGRTQNKKINLCICGEHGGDPKSINFCSNIGLDYVSCSPYRVPIARLAAAQAQIKKLN